MSGNDTRVEHTYSVDENVILLRDLEEADYDLGFVPLLEQLTKAETISRDFFALRLENAKQNKRTKILVGWDTEAKRVCASGTLVVEPKFIRSAGLAGHLEDLVVDESMRNKGLGRRLVELLVSFAREQGCYKVILDCAEKNVPFYEKCGFKKKDMCLSCYFPDTEEKPVSTRLDRHRNLPSMRPHMLDEEFLVRPLANEDFNSNFLHLLAQLTTVGEVKEEFFRRRLQEAQGDASQFIVVIEDVNSKRIVASGTLFVEAKFIHNAGLAGHIEDVVVDETIRGKGLGKSIVSILKDLAKESGCYKVILDCAEKNVNFYKKCGFALGHSPVCMSFYF